MIPNKNLSNRFHSLRYILPLRWFYFLYQYYDFYKLLKQSEKWDLVKIQNFQETQLKELLNHCNRHVPYYHNLFKSYKISLPSIKKISDVPKIPILTKDIIQNNTRDLQANNVTSHAFQKRSTGGTTGLPLSFYVEKAKWLAIHFAINRHYMSKAGYKPTSKVVSICGINKSIKYHPFFRTIELSSFKTSKSDYEFYFNTINKFNPGYITSFPSAFYLFTQYLIENNKSLNVDIKALFFHGEILPKWQKLFFKQTYNCKIFDQYGHREQCIFAISTPDIDYYNVYPFYGFHEVLDKTNNIVTKESEIGEIVATSLMNKVFPFIRYKTGDLAKVTFDSKDSEKQYPLIKEIIGRTQEFIIDKDNNHIPITGLYHIIAENLPHLKEFQLVQDSIGHILFNYLETKSLKDSEKKQIIDLFNNKLGDGFNYEFHPVQSIKRTKYGKYKYFIQKLSIDMNEK